MDSDRNMDRDRKMDRDTRNTTGIGAEQEQRQRDKNSVRWTETVT